MVRIIISSILLTLITTTLLSAQSPYAPCGHRQRYGQRLHLDAPADYPPTMLGAISESYGQRGYFSPTPVLAERSFVSQSPWDYGPSCGNRSRYDYPEYRISRRDLNTRRILRDRDKFVKNNIYGDDTIFDRDQPVRNIFRYVFP